MIAILPVVVTKKTKHERPSDNDSQIIEFALDPKASKETIARAQGIIEAKTKFVLLTKSEVEKLRSGELRPRKRGRKPQASTNVTEAAEAQRLAEIRRLLGPKAKRLTKVVLLRSVHRLLEDFREACNTGLFVASHERASLHVLAQEAPNAVSEWMDDIANGPFAVNCSWQRDLPSPDELLGWIEETDECFSGNGRRLLWAQTVEETIAKSLNATAPRETPEIDIFQQIKVALELKPDPENFQAKPGANEAPEAQEKPSISQPSVGVRSELYPAVSVPKTLQAATQQLFLLRHIVGDCVHSRVTLAVESLYMLCHSLSSHDPCRPLPSFVREIDRAFMLIIKRQRQTPLPLFSDEEMDVGPAWIPNEGEVTWL